MTETASRHASNLVNLLYYIVIIAAVIVFLKYLFVPCLPLIIAFVVAMVLQRPVNFIVKKLHIPRGIISTICVLLVYIVVFGIIGFLVVMIVLEFRDFFVSIASNYNSIDEAWESIVTWIQNLSLYNSLSDSIQSTIDSGLDYVTTLLASGIDEIAAGITDESSVFSSLIGSLGSGIVSTASQIPSFIIAFVITIVGTCFMTNDYKLVIGFIKRQIPDNKMEKLSQTKRIMTKTLGKIVLAYCIIICVTATEMAIGLFILTLVGVYSSDYIFVISIITALVDIVPVLGTGTILIPWAVYSLLTDSIGLGIGLIIMYIVITIIRQIMEPKLIASQAEISPVITIFAMYFGTKIFGVLGIFILPFICIVVKLLNDNGIIHLFATDTGDKEESQSVAVK